MTKLGPNEKLYPVVKIAMVVDALKDEGVPPKDALAGIRVSETQLGSPTVRVSANEVIQSFPTPLAFLETRILPTRPA